MKVICILMATILLSSCAGKGYRGPSLKFGIGYEGVSLSVTLIQPDAEPNDQK